MLGADSSLLLPFSEVTAGLGDHLMFLQTLRDKGTVNNGCPCPACTYWCDVMRQLSTAQAQIHRAENIPDLLFQSQPLQECSFGFLALIPALHLAFPLKGAHTLPCCGWQNVTQDHCDQHRPWWLLKTWVFSL